MTDMTHQCDPTLGVVPHNNPLTLSRTIRLVQARLDPRVDSAQAAMPILQEVGSCPKCLGSMLLIVIGMLGKFIPDDATDAVMAEFDRELAKALDEI